MYSPLINKAMQHCFARDGAWLYLKGGDAT
jgi:hypothetical protein